MQHALHTLTFGDHEKSNNSMIGGGTSRGFSVSKPTSSNTKGDETNGRALGHCSKVDVSQKKREDSDGLNICLQAVFVGKIVMVYHIYMNTLRPVGFTAAVICV